MKARMTVDPRLLTLIGKKLYSSNPLPIVVRELLQNSRDACIRKGVEPRIFIEIVVKSSTNVDVYCEDNGIGMTEEQLIDDFLCLGNTSKMNDSEAVGGFGIAKAALMRNPKWSVSSLDNYIDQRYILEDRDVLKVGEIEGTRISVHIDEPTYTFAFNQAIQMIYLSDVDVRLEATYLGAPKYVDDHAGWRNYELAFKAEEGMWLARTFAEQELDINSMSVSLQGKTFVRLGGLLQFAQQSYSGRKFNIMVDLSPEKRPDATDYPLTMSREEFSDAIKDDINDLVQECDENPVSALIEAERLAAKDTNIQIREGWLLRGKRNSEPDSTTIDDVDTKISTNVPKTRSLPSFTHQSLYLENYDEANRNALQDVKILKVWRELLIICADFRDPFGVGFKIHSQVQAARVSAEQGTHYVLNPDALDTLHAHEAKIHFLHLLACHETAHFAHGSHTEMHSIELAQIYEETIQEVQENMSQLIRIIR